MPKGNFGGFAFDEEVFAGMMQEADYWKNPIIASGIIQEDSSIMDLIGEKGNVATIPIYKPLDINEDGMEALNNDGMTNNTPVEVSGSKQTCMMIQRMKAFQAKDFTKELTGADPMTNIKGKIVGYYQQVWENELMNIAKAVTGVAKLSDHVTDLTKNTTTHIEAGTVYDAEQAALGDMAGGLGLMVMHSMIYKEWEYDTDYDEITNFHKGVKAKKMKIIISAATEEEGIAKRNDIFQIFESDILAEQSGRLYQDGYYLNCYIVASKKAKWYLTKRYIEIEVTIATDQPDWVQEREFNFLKTEGTTVEMDNLKKYPYKYGYYYLNQVSSPSINNVSITESDFVLRIYGSVSKPLVKIGDNTYQVNVSLNAGERLEIDSRRKTVKLIHTDGYTENVLWSAAKEYYIFEKIVAGTQIIAWDGSFSFDLILIDKRSEPLWK